MRVLKLRELLRHGRSRRHFWDSATLRNLVEIATNLLQGISKVSERIIHRLSGGRGSLRLGVGRVLSRVVALASLILSIFLTFLAGMR
jgi:hypothetical protein